MQQVVRKVPGGKMFRLKTEVKEGRLHQPLLTGDFFLMPSEKLRALEGAMEGWLVTDKKGLARHLNAVLTKEHASLIGISTEDIASALEDLS